MYEARNKSPADLETIKVLNEISRVTARLAKKLTILATQRQPMEGVKHYKQNERYGCDHRGAPQRRCRD